MEKNITIAITGHRDMIETEELKGKVSILFENLLKNTKTLTLLSPLADGADRFVAKIFLEKQSKHNQLTLIVPQPFNSERYLQDFDEVSTLEFIKLRNQALKNFSVTPSTQSGYLDVGRYVVNHSDILLALWDGTINGKIGGTADVVDYAKKKHKEIVHFLCEREN
jgi:hypothetical protein